MAIVKTKMRLFDDAGYAYNFDRMIFVNRQAKGL